MDMEKMDNLGIAYDNFHKHSMAVGCQRYFSGFSLTAWPGGNFSERNCRAEWSSIQGYEANIQRQKLNDWMNSKIPEVYKPMVFDEDGFRLPMIFFCRNLRQFIGHGRVPKLVNLAAMNMVRSGGWRNWYGWNGRQDGWSNGHFFCVKAISGWKRPQMAMPTALKDFQFRNAEKPDLGVREWKVMGIPLRRTELSTPRCLGFCRAIQIRKRVKLWSLESQHQSQKLWLEAEALASLAVARYACPNCSASFAKWSACYRHISHVSQGVMFADLQELQARCKEKAEKLSAFICRARRSGVKFRGYLGVTRYCTFSVKLPGPILGNENSCAAEVLICLISANCATSTGSVTTSILQQKKRETGAFPLACHSYDGNRVAKWKSWDKWLAHTFALHYGWSQPVSTTSHHEKHPKHPRSKGVSPLRLQKGRNKLLILARSRCRSKSLHDLASILGDQAGQAIPWCWTRLGMGNIGGDSFQESEDSGSFPIILGFITTTWMDRSYWIPLDRPTLCLAVMSYVMPDSPESWGATSIGVVSRWKQRRPRGFSFRKRTLNSGACEVVWEAP